MTKYSVKKPFTVFVAVIIILVIGAVSLTRMETNLLPEMDMPYMIVVTTYPGASPQKVEENVTKPMESALGTIHGVENVTSTSAENYSMVMLEFAEETNMDSAMVKVSSAINQVEGNLPEVCGTPNVMEISMDMMATMYASVSYDGKDIYDLSDFTEETVIPYLERQNGVASVSDVGLVEKTIEVRLNEKKIDNINEEILLLTNDKLSDAKTDLTEARNSLSGAKTELDQQEKALADRQSETSSQLADASLQLNQALATKTAYESELNSLKAGKAALEAEKKAYEDNGVLASYNSLNAMFGQMQTAVEQLNQAYVQMGQAAPLDTSQMPQDIKDAVEHPEKLEYFKSAIAMMAAVPGSVVTPEMETAALAVTPDSLKQVYEIVQTRIPQIDTELANLSTEIIAAQAVLDQVSTMMPSLDDAYKTAETGKISAAAGFGAGSAQIAAGKTAIEDAQKELEEADETYEKSKEAALENANLDKLLSLDTLSGLIYAQNFAMPAGYVDDKEDKQWLLKVGDGYSGVDELQNMVLTNVDGIGDITLADVSDITVLDNSGDAYAKVNGEQGVLLAVFKGSTAGTSDVSKACKTAIGELENDYPGLNITTLVDQGDYISMIIESIVSSMLVGALLAIVILAIFLMDIRPTLVVAFSIPFSVLTAIVIMFFTGISINMMSLSGLSLAVGMLVDNSIVVIENIYRLRHRGLEAPRAAVQGAKQVAGAIIASTLTTICVFLPMVFTTGLVRQLMLPFALTISFALIASLLVALTVVPTMGSILLKRKVPKRHQFFDRVQNAYAKVLDFCLRIKIVPIGIAVGLLIFCIYDVIQMGVTLIPDMGSDQITITAEMPKEDDKETAYQKADEIMDAVLSVEGIDYVGAMDGNSSAGMMGVSMSGAADEYSTFSFYALPVKEVTKNTQVTEICNEISEKVKGIDCEVKVSNSMMGEVDELLGSGLEIDIYGSDLEKLKSISVEIEDLVAQVDGFENITNGQEEADEEIHLVIDKDEAARLGTTVAQIYGAISDRLETDKKAVTMTVDETDMDVRIVDETNPLTKENLLDLEFETQTMDDSGNSVTETHRLSEVATLEYATGVAMIDRSNSERMMSVKADTKPGYNTTLLSREVEKRLADYSVPDGYSIEIGGEASNITDMLIQMTKLMLLGFLFIYLVMVAQFQSLLSPFIVIFTVPLAFTGGLLGLIITGEQLSLMSLIGFLVLMGTVVNNGIVFVDYTNQLRLGGMEKHAALIATGKTRMRPILMTAFTTILAMMAMVFSKNMASEMGRGMAIVVAGGLLYATLMTLFVVPVMYDILYRKQPREIDTGDDSIDDVPDDAAEFIQEMERKWEE